VRESFLEIGVAPEAVEGLIDKIEVGVPLDSYGGSAPLSTTSYIADGFAVIKSTYSDGSVLLSRTEVATESSGTGRTISGCSVSGPTYVRTYSNCTIDAWVGVYVFSFRADYQIQESSSDKVLDSYSPSVTCTWPVTCGSAAETINRATENIGAGLPAEAEMTFFGTAGPVSSTGHLFLRVGGNSAWQHSVV
jgi:hypothetical protein